MSLTNPNTVVTEQRLNDFYKGILPYMGGMPEMLANKFSKGDLYSTDEKMIGQWIDGKPLYQKSFTTTISTTMEIYKDQLYQGSLSIGSFISGIDMAFVDIRKSYYTTGGATTRGFISGWYEKDTGNIWFSTLYRRSDVTAIFTIQYTKTTDSPISIGDDTDYSTEEKIVGTWIDGKPIYQKTFDCGALPNNTTKQVAHGINNFYMIIQAFGTAHRTSDNACLVLPCIRGKGAGTVEAVVAQNISIDVDETFIYFTTAYNWSAITDKSYVTLQYIKTTD